MTRFAHWTAAAFGHPLAVLLFGTCTLGSGLWSVVAPSMLSLGLLLSFAALWGSAGIQFSGTQDTAEMKRAVAAVVIATPGADNRAAPTCDAAPLHLQEQEI